MGGDHGHHSKFPKIPDYRIYKVEEVPELVEVQRALARQGLKDPWLRNEVWRYNRKYFTTGSKYKDAWKIIGRGFWWGLGAAVLTITAEHVFNIPFHYDRHGHGHEGAEGGHH